MGGRLNELALFAGAGGGILGGKLLGWRTVCAVEINEYCQRILMQRQDDGILEPFPIWPDIRTFDGKPWAGCVDIVTGGFPCQAFSTASAGNQSAADLWPEMLRIIAEISPRFVFAENVSRSAIHVAAGDLEQGGYKTRVLPLGAADLGADHVRTRYWLLAYTHDESQLRLANHAEVAILPEFRPRVWETIPLESGMVDGDSDRMDRFQATGNMQVPAVVRAAWRILTGASDMGVVIPENKWEVA
jgi:DNA (cytosine-5)-methyltransferase 1